MFMNRELPAVPQGNPMASTVQVRGLSDLTGALCGGLYALDVLLSLGIAGFLCASGRRWRSRMAGS